MPENKQESLLVIEWDADTFHAIVLGHEKQGYEALRDTYRILAETDPETGVVRHQHSIQMTRHKAT